MKFRHLKHFFYYFKEEKSPFLRYTFLSLLAGFLELFGVALTYPFILKLLKSNSNNPDILTYLIGISIVLLFLLKNGFMIFYIKLQSKYTNALEQNIKNKFMKYFLVSSYQDTYKISLAQKGKIFNLLIPNTVDNFIVRLLNLNVNIIIFIFISVLLAVKFPLAMFLTTIFAVLFIKFQNQINKPLLDKYSQKASKSVILYNEAMNEATLNLKGIKISNKEQFFYKNFTKSMSCHYENLRQLSFLNLIPPYVIEPFIIILLFIMLSVITVQNYLEPDKLIASFALVASAIFRLAPTVARIQVNLNGINAALNFVQEILDLMDKYNLNNINDFSQESLQDLKDKIELQNISFEYEKGQKILQNINLIINKGEFIGISGASGVGKTTLIDIITGLYQPKSGEILIDGVKSNRLLKVGYIPQEFKFINASIRENVAFGNQDIDDDKVIKSLQTAQLSELTEKNGGIYNNPFIDSTGLSQGQKQRLAIARVLYTEPDILILDEATSSLDLKTEHEICNVLNELKGNKTIIVIAHRISTVQSADRIIFMKNGTISDIGTFEALLESSADFRELVKLNRTC